MHMLTSVREVAEGERAGGMHLLVANPVDAVRLAPLQVRQDAADGGDVVAAAGAEPAGGKGAVRAQRTVAGHELALGPRPAEDGVAHGRGARVLGILSLEVAVLELGAALALHRVLHCDKPRGR